MTNLDTFGGTAPSEEEEGETGEAEVGEDNEEEGVAEGEQPCLPLILASSVNITKPQGIEGEIRDHLVRSTQSPPSLRTTRETNREL